MNDNKTIVLHDLLVLEEMASGMSDYLDHDALDWTIPRVNMPKLTIGGYLMRQDRLTILRHLFGPIELERLDHAINTFNAALNERIVRFEVRAHQELHKRIREWMSHMRELSADTFSQVNYFAGIADTRVVISLLIEKLRNDPFKLEKGIVSQVAALDRNLQSRVEKHPFIWEAVWEPAYPAEKYWWLYSCLKKVNVHQV